jgi:hypothetical protein
MFTKTIIVSFLASLALAQNSTTTAVVPPYNTNTASLVKPTSTVSASSAPATLIPGSTLIQPPYTSPSPSPKTTLATSPVIAIPLVTGTGNATPCANSTASYVSPTSPPKQTTNAAAAVGVPAGAMLALVGALAGSIVL